MVREVVMHKIFVSLVFALPRQQYLLETSVMRGFSARDLIEQSDFYRDIPELTSHNVDDAQLGVYGQKIVLDYLLEDGDRVEIYRPLTADPKDVRRQLAMLGKTMGKK